MSIQKTIATLLAAFAYMAASAQTGAWSGAIDVQGTKINMTLHLDDQTPTLDVPTQGAKGIPATLTRNGDGSFTFGISAINASYTGKQNGNTIDGVFTQNGYSFKMQLAPGDKKPTRPQTPTPPFPYSTEEVSFSNGNAVLSGTLTLPKGYNKETPVAIMITGSGLQDRNSTIMGHQPFLVIADALARHGIATLRYDDRGFAKSTGDLVHVTTADLKDDARAGIKLLRERFSHVGVIGHSEGGTIAMMLGAEHQADFIVSLAGAAVSGKDILLTQNRKMLASAGLPAQTVEEYCTALGHGFDLLAAGKTVEEASQNSLSVSSLSANYKAAIEQMATPYGRYFLKMAGGDFLGKTVCPVLALNGTLDQQVECSANLDVIRKGLTGKNRKSEIMAEEGLNHLFQHCKTGAVNEYAEIEETFAPEVIDKITEWILHLWKL